MSGRLQGSHASRLSCAAVCLGSSVAWLLWAPVGSGRRLRWSLSASAGLLVSCSCGVGWSPGRSPGWLRGVRRDGSGAGWVAVIRAGRAAVRSLLGCSLLMSCGLRFSPCFACLASVGLRGVRADSLLWFEVATLRARRAGLRLLLLSASAASIGSAISSGWSSSVGRSPLRCSLFTLSGLCSPRAALLSLLACLLRSARLLGSALLGLAPCLASLCWSASPRLLRSWLCSPRVVVVALS